MGRICADQKGMYFRSSSKLGKVLVASGAKVRVNGARFHSSRFAVMLKKLLSMEIWSSDLWKCR